MNPLLRRLGVWIGLSFTSVVKGKKRVVQRLQSGIMTFGGRGLPVPLFGASNLSDPSAGQQPSQAPEIVETSQGSDAPREGEAAHPAAERDVVCGEGRRKSNPAGGGEGPRPPAGCCDRKDSARPSESRPEGISITKGSRGDWIRTSDLLNPIYGGNSQTPSNSPLTICLYRRKRIISMGLLRIC